jgi:hypothetical protein
LAELGLDLGLWGELFAFGLGVGAALGAVCFGTAEPGTG